MTDHWDAFQRSLPDGQNTDVKEIRGNISDQDKQISANGSLPFGNEIAGRLKVAELDVWDNVSTATAEAECVLGIEIAKILLSWFDGTGVSQSMNVHPAPFGSKIIVTTRSVFVDGRALVTRCESWNDADQ
ncbi:hypothetical protein B0H19DRAFT_1080663 [Mycena capillaripes]|nr:hypothetical protein B0H19DRAFT_1080663 [Mycena capillaripes]